MPLGNQTGVDRLLQTAGRALSSLAALLMTYVGLSAPESPRNAVALMIATAAYSAVAAAFALSSRSGEKDRRRTVMAGDILVSSILVGISGGLESPFFPLFLFAMSEAALYVEWRSALALIIGMNAAQVAAMGVRLATAADIPERDYIASRFSRLLVVGLLFVLFAEVLRHAERARTEAQAASSRIARLNAIFAQLAEAHLDVDRVFATLVKAGASLDGVEAVAILRKTGKADEVEGWAVAAGSVARAQFGTDPLRLPPDLESRALAEGCAQSLWSSGEGGGPRAGALFLGAFSTSPEEPPGLLLVLRGRPEPFSPEEIDFLGTLSAQARLALYNAFLFEERRRQLERLEAFKETQDAFFASAAHEFKTPLTVLSLLVESLALTIPAPDPRQREMLARITQNVGRLDGLSKNVLATARLEADDIAIVPRPTDPRLVVESVADELSSLAAGKGLSFCLSPEGKWPGLLADRARLRDILFNLLSNAVKFAREGSAVLVSARNVGEEVELAVRDRGEPIPQAETAAIFGKYYTGRAVGARAGTGLGLYIAQRLAKLHDGRIEVGNENDGVCFRLTLPRAGEDNHDE